MKKLIVIFIVFFSIATATVLGQVQMFGKYTEIGKLEPDINMFGYGPKLDTSGSLKLTYFALVEKSWAEGLIGISYTPSSWCELGLMFGVETNPAIYRLSGSIWMGNDKVAFYNCFEKGDGKNNWWYKSALSYSVTNHIALGLMSWRYNGSGLFLKNTFNNGLSLWINPGYDLELKEKKLIFGLDIKI